MINYIFFILPLNGSVYFVKFLYRSVFILVFLGMIGLFRDYFKSLNVFHFVSRSLIKRLSLPLRAGLDSDESSSSHDPSIIVAE